jgi:hypothetical protein
MMTIQSEIKTAGEFLRKQRLAKFKIQGNVANACGKTVSYWSALENGNKKVPAAIVEFAINYFELDDENASLLKKLAMQEVKEQKIDVSCTSDEAKGLAIAFAKHLKNFNSDQINQMKNIISKTHEQD